jgi:hypothetical protein
LNDAAQTEQYKNTPLKAAKGIVPDFVIENADLIIGSVLRSNKVYRALQMSEVIEMRLSLHFEFNEYVE